MRMLLSCGGRKACRRILQSCVFALALVLSFAQGLHAKTPDNTPKDPASENALSLSLSLPGLPYHGSSILTAGGLGFHSTIQLLGGPVPQEESLWPQGLGFQQGHLKLSGH